MQNIEIFYTQDGSIGLYDKALDSQGQYTGNIANVNADITIKVAFRLKVYTMEFYYWNAGTGSYEQVTQNGSNYILQGNSEEYKTIYGMGAFGWKVKDNQGALTPFTIPDEFALRTNYKLYAPQSKTLTDVQQLLGITETPESAM